MFYLMVLWKTIQVAVLFITLLNAIETIRTRFKYETHLYPLNIIYVYAI